jgi:peptide/nickel transport system substrate-binding protein
MESYWARFVSVRSSRRRALATAGAGTAAAMLLAACGGGGGGDSKDEEASGIITRPRDTFSQAKRGGTLKDFAIAEPRSLDPVNPQADLNTIAPDVYSTLLIEKPGKLKPSAYELQGQLAQSYELSPDGLQITMRLRSGVKWHNRPPVNGRLLDAGDVAFSLERFAKVAPLRTLVFNSASPDAPVLGASAPDARTVVIKLKEPVAYMPNWFAGFGSYTGQIIMYPKEAESAFDIRKDMIGTGPFRLKEHVPSVKFVLERNPDYWDKDFVLFDQIDLPIIGEYAARNSQLKAGNIHYSNSANSLRPEDTLPLKRAEPRIQLYETELVTTSWVITFGNLPVGNNKFTDERIRQAISMSLDRDLWIDAKYNVDKFQAEGLPVRTGWNSHLAYRDPFIGGGWFLDPQGKDFGPNARYFKFDLAEAKKLLSAAGQPNGFETTVHYPTSPQFNLSRDTEPLLGFWQELGLRMKQNAQTDYTQDYIPNNRDASGNYEGIGIHSVTGVIPSVVSPTSAMVAEHWPKSGLTFHGYDSAGKGDKSGDPRLTEMLGKARVERDTEARKKLVVEAQRYLGKTMYSVYLPGGASGFWAAWPALQNFQVWTGLSPWRKYQWWLDQTRAPFV